MKKVIYMDNNATTQVDERVLDAMKPFFCEKYGNPSSMHTFGGRVGSDIVKAREQVADLIGARPDEIIFTSCGTESDNAAINSALLSFPEKRHIVTTRVEHPSVLSFCKNFENRGYVVTYLSVDDKGNLDIEELKNSIKDDTAIVSIMAANNETGVIFPFEEIAAIVNEKGSLFHTDAVQFVGKLPLNMKDSNVDMLSLSGHKFHAPKGVGALYIRKGTRFRSFMIGGHQEKGRRAGTENVPLIVGLGKACELASIHVEEDQDRVKSLRDRLEKGLLEKSPDARVNGNHNSRLSNTSNISFEYIEGEAILLLLDQKGIAASSGSACTSGSLEPSHVLRAMGVPFTAAHGSVRFSLSRFNSDEDVDYVLENVPPVINRLREISPFGKESKD
ncbi:MAG: cysteine desulfurase NifS [Candidatus Theseobacter exili]|nr:cysteine desulfurase NifS [Candidatus Theseobacter exili]